MFSFCRALFLHLITVASLPIWSVAANAETCQEYVWHNGSARKVDIIIENQSISSLDIVIGNSATITDAMIKQASYQEIGAGNVAAGAQLSASSPIVGHQDHVFSVDLLQTPNIFRVRNEQTEHGPVSWYRGDSINLDYWEINEDIEVPFQVACNRQWQANYDHWVVQFVITDQPDQTASN